MNPQHFSKSMFALVFIFPASFSLPFEIDAVASSNASLVGSELMLELELFFNGNPLSKSETTHFSALGNPNASPCAWFGIMRTGGGVVEINLQHSGSAGKLESLDFSSLPSLTRLHLWHNYLFGLIPSSISLLNNLTTLDLSQKRLVRNLPLFMANLSRISEIDLSLNELKGKLTLRLFTNWTILVSLRIHSNQLEGQIPSEFGSLASLQLMSLFENNFSGMIPPQVGQLSNLITLHLGNNNLTGPIPSSIGNLTKLQPIDIFENYISGAIPDEIGNLENLIRLEFSYNLVTGSVPLNLENLTKLASYLVLRGK